MKHRRRAIHITRTSPPLLLPRKARKSMMTMMVMMVMMKGAGASMPLCDPTKTLHPLCQYSFSFEMNELAHGPSVIFPTAPFHSIPLFQCHILLGKGRAVSSSSRQNTRSNRRSIRILLPLRSSSRGPLDYNHTNASARYPLA